jgi:predicted Rossmann-fold nucleotide-binding protein
MNFIELLTLVQTKKIQRIPIVLYGTEFWGPLVEFFKNNMLKKFQTISKEDLDLFVVVDTVDDAMKYIVKAVDGENSIQM